VMNQSNEPTRISKDEPIRLLVVDDHAIVRKGLVALLNTIDGLSVVAEASDGEQAIEAHRAHKPDITLMDLRLPKLGGADAIARDGTGCETRRIGSTSKSWKTASRPASARPRVSPSARTLRLW